MKASASSTSSSSLMRRRSHASMPSPVTSSTLRDIQEAPAASTPSLVLSQAKQLLTFVLSLFAVRWVWYEWRPYHEFSWWREVAVWITTWRLYVYLMKRQRRRPLLNYGRWALLVTSRSNGDHTRRYSNEDWAQALAARGMRVALLVDATSTVSNTGSDTPTEEEDDDSNTLLTTTKHVHETVLTHRLEYWLGHKQWEGGVGVVVIEDGDTDWSDGEASLLYSSQSDHESPMQVITRHMMFRHSGAILRILLPVIGHLERNNEKSEAAMSNASDDKKSSTGCTQEKTPDLQDNTDHTDLVFSDHGIVVLDIPSTLLSSQHVVDAALEKVGETRRLSLRHVLWQRVKQAWRMRLRW